MKKKISTELHERYMALAHKDFYGMRELCSDAIEAVEVLELRLGREQSSALPSEPPRYVHGKDGDVLFENRDEGFPITSHRACTSEPKP